MAEVEVTITVSDEGVVQRVRAGTEEFARLEETVDDAAQAGDEFANTQQQVADGARQSGDGAAQAANQMSAYQKAVQALNDRGIKTTDQLQQQRQELIKLQQQFPQNSRAARQLQAEIDRLGDKIGSKSVQDIQRQIQQLQQLEQTLTRVSGVLRGVGVEPPISQQSIQSVEAIQQELDGMSKFASDATQAVGKVQKRIQTLNQELRETRTPDTQITAYEQAVRDLNEAGVVTTSQLEDMRDELEILQGVFSEDERVVQQLQQQIERLNREIEMQGQESQEAADDMREQASVQERLNDLGIRTSDQLERQIADLQDLQSELNEGSRAYNRLEDRIVRMREQLERSGQATAEFGRQTAKSRQFIFSAGDAVQDLQFGIAGAGNNIAFMAEQLAEMNATATSSGSILNSLGTAILGPAGLILGLQALIALGPTVAETLQEMASESDQLNVSVEDATESFGEMLSLLNQQQREFSVSKLVAEELRQEFESLTGRTGIENFFLSLGGALNRVVKETELAEGQVKSYRLALRDLGSALQGREGVQQALRDLGISVEDIMNASELSEEELRSLREQFAENSTEVRNFSNLNQGAAQALEDIANQSEKASLKQRQFNRAIENGLSAQQLYANTQQQLTELAGNLQDKLELGLISEQEALERQAALIEEVLNLAAGTDLADTEPIQNLREQWEALNEEIGETEDTTEESTSALTETLDEFVQLQEQLAFEEEIGLGTELSRAKRKTDFLREALKDLGPEADTSSDAFQFLVDKLEQYSQKVDSLEESSVVVEELRSDYIDLIEKLRGEVQLGVKEPAETAKEEVRFLEKALSKVAEAGIDMDQKGVQELRNSLQTARGVLTAYEEDVEGVLSAQEMFEQRFFTGSDAAKRFQDRVAGMSDEIQRLSGTDRALAAFQNEIGQVRNAIEKGMGEQAQFKIKQLRNRLEEMTDEGRKASEQFPILTQILNQLEGAANRVTEPVETLEEALSKIGDIFDQQFAIDTLTQGFTELGRAIVETESTMMALRNTALQILADIARAIGQKLIAMGTATILENPAKGAAMIAAGGTLLTLAGAMSASARSGTRESTTESGSTGAGGAAEDQELTAQESVDVPGRRTGGPVVAGQPYMVGEGESEMFVPQIDGAVIPRSAFSSGGRRRQLVDIRSRAEAKIGLDRTLREFGLEMRDLINQVESDVAQST